MAIMATLAQGREYTQDYLNSITISQADDRYCLVLGDCQLRNLNITGNFSFYGDVLNITVTNIYINATLIEGLNQTIEDVGNDIWVNELGDFMTGGLNITTSTNINSLAIIPTGDAGESTSLGGALLIRNTDNIGGALTIYSNADSTADSHLLQVRADNADFDRDAVHVFYDGTNDGLNVQNSGTGTANSALVLTSTNDDSSTMEITGTEISKGVIKITHDGNSGDTSASAIAIDLQGDKTAAQGIVIDSTDGGTSGSLLLLRNNNSNNKFQVTRNGTVVIEESIIFETSPLSWILNLRGVRTQSASSFFFDMFNGGKFFWRDSNNQNVMELSQGGIKAYKDINLSEKVLYNASDIHAERYCDPYSSCYNTSDFLKGRIFYGVAPNVWLNGGEGFTSLAIGKNGTNDTFEVVGTMRSTGLDVSNNISIKGKKVIGMNEDDDVNVEFYSNTSFSWYVYDEGVRSAVMKFSRDDFPLLNVFNRMDIFNNVSVSGSYVPQQLHYTGETITFEDASVYGLCRNGSNFIGTDISFHSFVFNLTGGQYEQSDSIIDQLFRIDCNATHAYSVPLAISSIRVCKINGDLIGDGVCDESYSIGVPMLPPGKAIAINDSAIFIGYYYQNGSEYYTNVSIYNKTGVYQRELHIPFYIRNGAMEYWQNSLFICNDQTKKLVRYSTDGSFLGSWSLQTCDGLAKYDNFLYATELDGYTGDTHAYIYEWRSEGNNIGTGTSPINNIYSEKLSILDSGGAGVITLSQSGQVNASDIHAERYCDPYSSCYNVSDFMGSFIRNDTDANLRNVSIFNLTVIDTIISEYVGKALNLISFGWFNHINALDINTTNLTSIRATIQNLTTPNYIKGEPKKQGFTIIDPHGVYLATSQHFFPVQSELASDISINITRVVCGIENRSLNLNWSLNYADFLSNRTNQVRIFSMNTTGAVCDSEDIEVIVPINKTLYVDFHDQEPLSQVETATATIFYRVVG